MHKIKKDRKIRPYTIVKMTDEYIALSKQHNIKYKDDHFLFINEIVNMPGHVYLVGMSSGVNYTGLHLENFVEVPEEEI
jgi:hypothetical protein